MFRVISANLNGIRSAVQKGFLTWMTDQDADFICIQELKAQKDDLTECMRSPVGYRGYFHFAEKKGYSGVGIYARTQPNQIIEGLGVSTIDTEGRYIELIYDTFSIISVYLPSGSSGDHRQLAKYIFMEHFFSHLQKLKTTGREYILCGDWNIAHHEIDLKNWRANQKNSGFLPEERAWLTRVLTDLDFVDVYRRLYPEATNEGYTWWSNRGQAWVKNVGWRIDYHIASPTVAARALRAQIFKEARFSDHAPLIIDYAD